MRNSGWCLLQFIKPHKTAPMFIQERGEELIERFSYCSYTFHHHYVNQRQYHFIWKVFTSCRQHLTVHCKHKREKDTSWHQWICFFFPDMLLLNERCMWFDSIRDYLNMIEAVNMVVSSAIALLFSVILFMFWFNFFFLPTHHTLDLWQYNII